jgi:hypothetical protein
MPYLSRATTEPNAVTPRHPRRRVIHVLRNIIYPIGRRPSLSSRDSDSCARTRRNFNAIIIVECLRWSASKLEVRRWPGRSQCRTSVRTRVKVDAEDTMVKPKLRIITPKVAVHILLSLAHTLSPLLMNSSSSWEFPMTSNS